VCDPQRQSIRDELGFRGDQPDRRRMIHSDVTGLFVDGIDDERFQVYAVLLAICKVNLSPLDVQWNGWLFEYRA